jgi:hypothetical protein
VASAPQRVWSGAAGADSGEVEHHSGRKSNTIPEGSRTAFRDDSEHHSERSDAGFLIVREVFGLVKETPIRSEAEAGGHKLGKGCGERDTGPVPRSALERPGGR